MQQENKQLKGVKQQLARAVEATKKDLQHALADAERASAAASSEHKQLVTAQRQKAAHIRQSRVLAELNSNTPFTAQHGQQRISRTALNGSQQQSRVLTASLLRVMSASALCSPCWRSRSPCSPVLPLTR